jgi:hypothetical protein
VNISDVFIIYLACGAPFGVYNLLQHRESGRTATIWFNAAVNFLFWPVSAFRLVNGRAGLKDRSNTDFDALYELDALTERRVAGLRKEFENLLFGYEGDISIYGFREVFDRYTGLTVAVNAGFRTGEPADSEISQIAGHKNVGLASVCLERRNRTRLLRHQIQAREDFSKALLNLAGAANARRKTEMLAIDLAGVLNDVDALVEFQGIFVRGSQIEGPVRVREIGRDLWKPEVHKPLTSNNHHSAFTHPVPATLNSRSED